MIAKLTKGTGFRGAAAYLLRRGRGDLIGGNMAGKNPRELAQEFGELRKLRPGLGRAVAHFSLSLPPDERKPGNAEWEEIAKYFLEQMGFAECPFVVARHDDTEHAHIHLLVSRINFSGEVVTDKNDFRRAEAIVRQIEALYGFQAVPSSTKKQQQRSDAMNTKQTRVFQEPHNLTADIAVDGSNTVAETSCHAGDQPNDKKRREMRRAIRETGYDQLVANLLGSDFKHVYHHQRGAVIYTTDGGRIHDNGDQLTAYNMNDRLAAQRMVALAVSRGWTSVVFTGPEAFIREAMQEAIAQGLPVRPKDAVQQAIMDEILDMNCGVAGIEAPPAEITQDEPTPELQPEPDQEAPLLDIAARLKRRREFLATPPKPRDPRGPSFR